MPATRRFLNRARSQRAMKKTRYVVVNPETKYALRNIVHAAVASSTTVLTAIAAGSGTSGGRDGRKIKLKSLSIMLTTPAVPVRCILYVPKTASDTLAMPSYFSGTESDQFWILKDIWLNQANSNVQGTTVTYSFPMGLNVEFDGDATTDQVRNPVKMLLFAAGTYTIEGHSKVWYTDV